MVEQPRSGTHSGGSTEKQEGLDYDQDVNEVARPVVKMISGTVTAGL
jgi:hypothetical protein